MRDPDRGHFDPHGDVRRSSSWRVARFILASDQRIPFFERSRTEGFRSVVECPVCCTRRPSLDSFLPHVFRTFFKGGWSKRGRRGPRLKEFPPSSTVNSTIVNAFCPPPPHLRPAALLRLNESIRRFTCFHLEQTFFLPTYFRFSSSFFPLLFSSSSSSFSLS